MTEHISLDHLRMESVTLAPIINSPIMLEITGAVTSGRSRLSIAGTDGQSIINIVGTPRQLDRFVNRLTELMFGIEPQEIETASPSPVPPQATPPAPVDGVSPVTEQGGGGPTEVNADDAGPPPLSPSGSGFAVGQLVRCVMPFGRLIDGGVYTIKCVSPHNLSGKHPNVALAETSGYWLQERFERVIDRLEGGQPHMTREHILPETLARWEADPLRGGRHETGWDVT